MSYASMPYCNARLVVCAIASCTACCRAERLVVCAHKLSGGSATTRYAGQAAAVHARDWVAAWLLGVLGAHGHEHSQSSALTLVYALFSRHAQACA